MVSAPDLHHLRLVVGSEEANEPATEDEHNLCDQIKQNDEKKMCPFCKQKFRKQNEFDKHMFQHTQKKAYVCDHKGCTKEYINNQHLKRHKKTHDKSTKIADVYCKYENCFQVFTNTSNMNRHFKTAHLNPCPYECNVCQQRFRRKTQLKNHQFQHTGQYPYRCLECGKGFVNTLTFIRHQTTHKIKIHECPDCKVAFVKWSLFVEHRRTVHKNAPRFECDLCARTFSKKRNIKEHMRVHTPVTDDNIFQCSYEGCSKLFLLKRNLITHVKSKHEGKRWKCDICTRELSSKHRMLQHLKAHTDPKRAERFKKSTVSKMLGLILPTRVEATILKGKGLLVPVTAIGTFSSLPAYDSTSATELSDC